MGEGSMTFAEAKTVLMPFGKHKGKTVDQIAETDQGLKYLDWLAGEEWVSGRIAQAVAIYLADPSIKRELESLQNG